MAGALHLSYPYRSAIPDGCGLDRVPMVSLAQLVAMHLPLANEIFVCCVPISSMLKFTRFPRPARLERSLSRSQRDRFHTWPTLRLVSSMQTKPCLPL